MQTTSRPPATQPRRPLIGDLAASAEQNPAQTDTFTDCQLETSAVVFEAPREIGLRTLGLIAPSDGDVVVDVDWSGDSTGTERLLWSGAMPPFPGMGYPLVPGYESVGRVIATGAAARNMLGAHVFAPGSRGFEGAHGLFGGAAQRLVVPADRVTTIDPQWADSGVLLALAATALHAINGGKAPDLIIGHGVLGRLLARLAIALDAPPPVVWEVNPDRADADGYAVIDPDWDGRKDYRSIYDVSGDGALLDTLIGRLAFGGEIVLAGFYAQPLSFCFAPAFMREARLRIAAEWKKPDLDGVVALIRDGRLSLDGLITHRAPAMNAPEAYCTAFQDPTCLKMVLDWRGHNERLI